VGGRAFVFSKAKSKSWLFDTILIQLVIYRIRIYGSESLQAFLAFPSSYFGKNKNNFRQKKKRKLFMKGVVRSMPLKISEGIIENTT
jgi:hypothetical protein